jgi:ADP-ribose pyrophosphatase YjhB (NUDIX family)
MQTTATAVFIKDSKILLEKRKEDEDNYAGFWALPGGHKKKEEKIEQTLRREMQEELNVKVTKDRLIGKFKDKDPTSKELYEHNAFLCLEWDGNITHTTEEERVRWHDLKDIKNLRGIRPVDIKILKKAKVI